MGHVVIMCRGRGISAALAPSSPLCACASECQCVVGALCWGSGPVFPQEDRFHPHVYASVSQTWSLGRTMTTQVKFTCTHAKGVWEQGSASTYYGRRSEGECMYDDRNPRERSNSVGRVPSSRQTEMPFHCKKTPAQGRARTPERNIGRQWLRVAQSQAWDECTF